MEISPQKLNFFLETKIKPMDPLKSITLMQILNKKLKPTYFKKRKERKEVCDQTIIKL
jgi:hypothetical protein